MRAFTYELCSGKSEVEEMFLHLVINSSRGKPPRNAMTHFQSERWRTLFMRKEHSFMDAYYIMESLILAQNERWRRVLSMQVER